MRMSLHSIAPLLFHDCACDILSKSVVPGQVINPQSENDLPFRSAVWISKTLAHCSLRQFNPCAFIPALRGRALR